MRSGEERRILIDNPRLAAEYFMPKMRNLERETLRCAYLDAENTLIDDQLISIGTLDASIAEPRDVFRSAIAMNVASIILVHNHPNGNPMPSPHDIEVTKKLATAGNLIGITVVDHIIIGDGGWTSLKQEDLF
ncbi:MAG: DNA repair protein RadC [Thermoplasmata archaeon]|nr:DNA repair protein RadC [Thermoplasmata archaeon]